MQVTISRQNGCSRDLNSWYWNNQMRFLECLIFFSGRIEARHTLTPLSKVRLITHSGPALTLPVPRGGGQPPPPRWEECDHRPPWAHLKSRRHVATAFAAAQERMAPPTHPRTLAQPSSAGDVVPAGPWPSQTICPPPPRPTLQGARAARTHQLWVPLFLALPRSGENHTISLNGASVGGPVTAPTSCLLPTATSQRAAVHPPRPPVGDHLQRLALEGPSPAPWRWWRHDLLPPELQHSWVQTPGVPMLPSWRMRHGGGQMDRLDGHTCTHAETAEVGDGSGAAKPPWTGVVGSSSRLRWAQWWGPCYLQAHSETAPTPGLVVSSVQRGLPLWTASTRDAASCCHPPLSIPGSKSSGSKSSGLVPSHRDCHVGGSKPMVPLRTLTDQISLESFSMETSTSANDDEIINPSHAQVYVFSDSVLCLAKWTRTHSQTLHGRKDWRGSKVHQNTELWTQSMENRWNSSGIFPGSTTLELVREVHKFMNKLGDPEQFQGRIIFMSMFNDIIWWNKESSSTRRITSRRIWCDRNLETERWSSEQMWGGGNKKRFQFCTDPSRQEILPLRTLQGHSERHPIDLYHRTMHWFWTISSSNIYHNGCAVSLHSVTNSGLIAGRQNSSKARQTAFFTTVNTMRKNHKDPRELDLTKPRFASCKAKVESAPRQCTGSIYTLLNGKRLKLYQTRRTWK